MIKAHNETHITVFYIFISDFMLLLFNYMNVLILVYMKWFKCISLIALFFYLNYNCIHLFHWLYTVVLILNYTMYSDKLCMPCN